MVERITGIRPDDLRKRVVAVCRFWSIAAVLATVIASIYAVIAMVYVAAT